jgi:hypothetical protein
VGQAATNKHMKCEDDVQPIANKVPFPVRVFKAKNREKP